MTHKDSIEEQVERISDMIAVIFMPHDQAHAHSLINKQTIRKALEAAEARGREEERKAVIGNIGAELLRRQSPQPILDAYFDVANEELEKYATD